MRPLISRTKWLWESAQPGLASSLVQFGLHACTSATTLPPVCLFGAHAYCQGAAAATAAAEAEERDQRSAQQPLTDEESVTRPSHRSDLKQSMLEKSVRPASEPTGGSLTEEQLAELFDTDLQQRLASAAAAARRSSSEQAQAALSTQHVSWSPASAPESTPQGFPSGPSFTSPGTSVASSSSSSSLGPSVQQLSRPWPAGPASWGPLASSDPWGPLPTPALARQRLPDQVLLLLQQAGVSHSAAAEAFEQLAITSDVPNSSSSEDHSADETSATQSSDSSSSSHGTGQARKLFGQSVPAAQSFSHPALQRPQQQQQQQGPMAVLNRLQTRQLVQVLEDCQAPTFGDKQVLLQRLVLLLQEQWSLQDAHSRQQQQPQPQDDQQEQYGTHTVLQAMDKSQQQQQQQQQRQHKGQQPASRQLPEIAAQQVLLQSVLDVQQIGRWLLAARAQDVCIVDVRGRAGKQTHLVIATGLNQRHTRALADAVAWQLTQAAQHQLDRQQGQQQQQEELQQEMQQQQHKDSVQHQDPLAQQGQQSGTVQQQGQPTLQQPEPLLPHSLLHDLVQQHQHQREQQQGTEPMSSVPAAGSKRDARGMLPPLNVVGDGSSDWCLLDAGSVTVHVLTDRARQFYALEALWGGSRGRFIQWLKSDQAQLQTKDTIGRPALRHH